MIDAHEIEATDSSEVTPDSQDRSALNPSRGGALIDLSSPRPLIAIMVLLVLVAFANSLSGDFVYDDRELILENQLAGRWDRATLQDIFTRDSWSALRPELAQSSPQSVYYRPLFIGFLIAGHSVAGKSSVAWHLLVVMLHAIATILAFLVLEKSLSFVSDLEAKQRRLISTLAASIFAIHPAQSESVAWISGLVNSLSAALVLAAVYFYLKHREADGHRYLALSLGFFTLAILTKESSLAVLLIVTAYELVAVSGDKISGRWRSGAWRIAPFVVAAAGYFALRYSVLKALLGRTQDLNFPENASLTLGDNLMTAPALLTGYLRISFFPARLSLIYDFGYVRSLDLISFWLPLFIVAGAAAGLACLSRHLPEVRIASVWMIVPLLPHLNTRAFVSDEIIHDRYLYLSLVGVGLLVATLVIRASRRVRHPAYALAASGVFLLVLATVTVAQNRQWRDEPALWRNAARTAPNTRTVRLAVGALAEGAGDFEGALREYEQILSAHPDVIDALNQSAFVYARLRRWSEATQNFERIAAITPEKAIPHFNLSFAYAVQRRYQDAAREQRRAIELDPNGPRADEWRLRLAQLEREIATARQYSNPG